MATPLESNHPAKDKDSKGLSSLNEFNLERSVLRRGLAPLNEIELCKAHKAKLANTDSSKSLLDIMVEARVLTKNQSMRLLQEIGATRPKLEIPGYQIIEKLGKGSMGIVYKAKPASVDRYETAQNLGARVAPN